MSKAKARAGLREIQPGEFRSSNGQDSVLTGEALLISAKEAGHRCSIEGHSKKRKKVPRQKSNGVRQQHFRGGGRRYASLPR